MGEKKAVRLVAETTTQIHYDNERRLSEKADEIHFVCKKMQLALEHMNAILMEADTNFKAELIRVKKMYQVQINELETSLDVAKRNNIELQKTIKKQTSAITGIRNQYDELQRQQQTTPDQYTVFQRRVQALTAELQEMRSNIDAAVRAKRQAEQLYEGSHARINELTNINLNISEAKSKLECEYSTICADYNEISKELKLANDRANHVMCELKRSTEIQHEEKQRITKIESIRKSLEAEAKNLQTRLDELEANNLGGKRVIRKLEARIRDIDVELDEEKRHHAETNKLLRKKECQVKEMFIQMEEDGKNINLLTEQVEKLNEKVKDYKRQLSEKEVASQSNLTSVRKYQRELEAAEERAENAETNMKFIRAKHRSWVTNNQKPSVENN